jgi:hypothetical protein
MSVPEHGRVWTIAMALPVLLVPGWGCENRSEGTAEPPSSRSEEPEPGSAKPRNEKAERAFESFQRWLAVVPRIDEQVLERDGGAVTIQFHLRNDGDEAACFNSYEAHFIAGTYHRHPSGEPYTIEGDERCIEIWFQPSTQDCEHPDLNRIDPNEERSFTVSAAVPDDLPNPVEVSVCVAGPIVEFNSVLGSPQSLRWVEKQER